MRAFFLILLLLPASVDSGGINTRVYPQAIMAGSSVWLTCRVTPNVHNRTLVYGIVNSEQENTERQLNGYDAPITWGPIEVKRVPCGAGPAYCTVLRADGSKFQNVKPLTVSGCEM